MNHEIIWIVEQQSEIASMLAFTLEEIGHTVYVMESGGAALSSQQPQPALVLADLHLPGLTGKDLLVALRSRGITAPVIVLAQQGEPEDIVQAFRLGAADYLTLPVRDAQLVAAVNRVLEQHSATRERDALLRQVQQTNQTLERRIRDQQTIAALGKAVVSTTDTHVLFQKIVDGGVYVSQAQIGWLMLQHANHSAMVLASHHGLPQPLNTRLHRHWDDGISLQVARLGQPLTLSGKAISQLQKIKNIGKSLLAVPLMAGKDDIAGVLVMLRNEALPFSEHDQAMLSAVADYAAISIINARMMRVLDERALRLQRMARVIKLSEQIKASLLKNTSMALREPLTSALGYTEMVLEEQLGALNNEQTQALTIIQEKIAVTSQVAEHLTSISDRDPAENKDANLQAIVTRVLEQQQKIAQSLDLSFKTIFDGRSDTWHFTPTHLERVLEAIVVKVFNLAPPGSQLLIETNETSDKRLVLSVRSQTERLTTKQATRLTRFETQGLVQRHSRFSGISIELLLAKEICAFYGAELQVKTETHQGIEFRLLFAPQ